MRIRLGPLVAWALVLGPWLSAQERSTYVPMRDGTRLAVDVYLPAARGDDGRVPALVQSTRYWRAREDPGTGKRLASLDGLDRTFLDAGYAVVKLDVRGTGASFGARPGEYSPQEVRDGHDVVEWVVAQDWCDGAVGAYGTSYSGTTAELLAASGHPAVRAVIPGWSDFEVYRGIARPYGLATVKVMDAWGALVGQLDRNDVAALGASVARVDEDRDGELLRAAVQAHAANPDVGLGVRSTEFRDQGFGCCSFDEISVPRWKEAIEASGVPMFVLVSWLDAGTAQDALRRFRHFSNPQTLLIQAGSHGGFAHASPYVVSRSLLPPVPPVEEQFALQRAFFDHHLKGLENGVEDWPAVRYHNMGEEVLRSSAVWPPAGTRRERSYLTSRATLEGAGEELEAGLLHAADLTLGTGRANRWMTQLGLPIFGLDDREEADERSLVFTGAPLELPLQVSGTPVVALRVRADREDWAVLAYLEDVAEDGRTRLVSEGGLRVTHRRLEQAPVLDDGLPWPSHLAADRLPYTPGQTVELVFRLQPTSVRFAAGHRLRLALTAGDADAFERLPAEGELRLEVLVGGPLASSLELPVTPIEPR